MQLTLNKITYILIFFFVLISCHKSDKKNSKEVFKKKGGFHYREIVIDSVRDCHTYNRKNGLNCLFGKWTITSIADVGGTMINEKKIQSQIGKKILINETNFEANFLGNIFKTNQPSYSIISNKGDKGSSLWFGYLPSRDSVFYLIVKNEKKESYFYIELISCKEIATYYDGRIYFYSKQNK